LLDAQPSTFTFLDHALSPGESLTEPVAGWTLMVLRSGVDATGAFSDVLVTFRP
jgi:hypothetical protein